MQGEVEHLVVGDGVVQAHLQQRTQPLGQLIGPGAARLQRGADGADLVVELGAGARAGEE